jgi:transposase
MFYMIDPEAMVPVDHPLRAIKRRVDAELRRMRDAFRQAYAKTGRPSIPPEQLIKATLLQALYTIRSERQMCEETRYNMLYRWFLDLSPEAKIWDHSTFSKNRDRFAEHGLMQRFFEGSVAQAISEEAASLDHFTVDGTLIEAWASMKSVRPKDEPDDPTDGGDSNRWVDWHGEKRSNETHASRTDGEARLARKGHGQPAILAHSLHALMENRNGLLLDVAVDEANGTAERDVALEMLGRVRRRHWLLPETLGMDTGYDDGPYLETLERDRQVVPHVPIKKPPCAPERPGYEARRRARRRRRNVGYQKSQHVRKRVEEIIGWLKTIGGLKKTRFVGRWKTQLYAHAAGAAWNFLRLANLEAV